MKRKVGRPRKKPARKRQSYSSGKRQQLKQKSQIEIHLGDGKLRMDRAIREYKTYSLKYPDASKKRLNKKIKKLCKKHKVSRNPLRARLGLNERQSSER